MTNKGTKQNLGLSLFYFKNSDQKFVLLDTELLLALKIKKAILGVVYISPGKEYTNIEGVRAKNGYGPLMYDISLSHVYPGFIEPSWQITDDAKNIWNYYFHNRQDVEKVLNEINLNAEFNQYGFELMDAIDEYNEKKSKANLQKVFDIAKTDPLAYKYKIIKPINLSPLLRNGQKALNLLGDKQNLLLANVDKQSNLFLNV